jgi:hypothetical protein
MTDFVENSLKQIEEQTKNKTKKEQNEALFNYLSDVLEVNFHSHNLLKMKKKINN